MAHRAQNTHFFKSSELLRAFVTLCFLGFLMGISMADPIISEFMASNDTTLQDEDGNSPDWIEIHNPDTLNPVDLSGWHLTDDSTALAKWTFPSVSIPAGGYLVVFASDKDRATAGSELHTNFKLSAGGDYLALVKPDGTTIATEFSPQFPVQYTDVSYGIFQGTSQVETVVDEGANLRYHVPVGPVANWNTDSYNDTGSSWSDATSSIGYENDPGSANSYTSYINTDIKNEVYRVHNTVYLRYHFNVTDASAVSAMTLLTKCDDGFVAYLNGEFLASQNAPVSPLWWSAATSSIEANLASFDSWNVTNEANHLNNGDNVLAIQLLNQGTNSSDLLMIPKLEITTTVESQGTEYNYFLQPTPGAINNTPIGEPSGPVAISEPSGIKTSSIDVTLTSTDPYAEIRYTLDGTEPDQSSALYTGSFITLSDPAQLRARAYEAGKIEGPMAIADYSFIDSSLQSYLSDVPIIVMDNFGAGSYPSKGRSNDGSGVMQVERQTNIMSFFDTAGDSLPFSQNPSLETRAGCRVRGSSSVNFPRKPLSVEFWDNDNNDRSLSPFGMDAEADWVLYAPYQLYDKSLLHNPVTFEVAKLLGALAPNSQVVVVFQNKDGGKITSSDMNGVYIFMEKIERNRIGVNFSKMNDAGDDGGWMIKVDRLDAIPVGMPANTVQPNFHAAGPNGILEILDDVSGDSSPQPEDDISEFYHSFLNFASPDGYDILPDQRTTVQSDVRAMDAAVWDTANFNNLATGYNAHLDSESWASFYAVQNFAKNNDAIVLSTHLYKESPNSKIKMGPVWDFDRAYTQNGSATSSPLAYSNYDWYEGLFDDINFKQVHQDIWQEARRTSMSNTVLENIVDQAATGLREDQIIASGLSFSSWQSRVSEMKTWMVARANYLDNQYEALPTISPLAGEFSGSVQVTMTPTAGGSIYYTIDGTDPRSLTGGLTSSARYYSGPITLTERAHVVLRTWDGRWSGKIDNTYYKTSEIPQLVISEIGYHPADPTPAEIEALYLDADDFEYLEIQNVGSSTVDLRTLILSGGIDFDFSTSSISNLAAGERVLVVRNLAAFQARFGSSHLIAGTYTGALNNAGDRITLTDPFLDPEDQIFQDFSYSDKAPWPTSADGIGYSLILKQPETKPDHSLASSWRCSSHPTGNPGESDARPAFAGNALDDLDGDGVSALVEHFLGTSDQDSSAGTGQYHIGMVTLIQDGLTYPTLEVTYDIGADDVYPDGIWSQDMDAWSLLPANVLLHSHTLNGDGTATLIWRSTLPNTNSPQFFRLKLSEY